MLDLEHRKLSLDDVVERGHEGTVEGKVTRLLSTASQNMQVRNTICSNIRSSNLKYPKVILERPTCTGLAGYSKIPQWNIMSTYVAPRT